jgi:hypothetical protein
MQPAPHIPWSIEDDSCLCVGSGEELIEIRLADRQTDSVTVIDICRCPGKGLMEGACGAYVMSVEIPPTRYKEEVVEDFDGSTVMNVTPEPLDVASVVLRLWSINDTDATEMELF